MKKLAKILLVVLALAVITGAFAFVAMADGATEEVTPWTPPVVNDPGTDVDETNPAIAIFESEADYLAGNVQPVILYSNTIDQSITQAWSGAMYVRFFTDVEFNKTSDASWLMWFKKNVNIIIDLGGNHLNVNSQSRTYDSESYAANLTIKNGSVKFASSFGYKRQDNITFDNVTVSGVRLGFCSGGNLTFKNSTVSLDNTCPFSLGPTASGAAEPSRVTFINTDVKVTSVSIASSAVDTSSYAALGIFEIYYNEAYALNYEIRIDKDSTFFSNTKNANLIGINYGPDLPTATTEVEGVETVVPAYSINLYIEEGAKLKNVRLTNNKPDYTYNSTQITGDAAFGSASENPDVIVNVAVVEPGTAANADGYKVKVFDDGIQFFYDEADIVRYTPSNGVSVALFTNQDYYELGFDPYQTYTETSFNSTITQTWNDGTYAVVYTEIDYTTTDFVASSRSVTVDLNGNTFNAKNTFRVAPYGANGSLTFNNGTFKASGQVHFRIGQSLAFDNCTVISTALGYASGGNLRLTDCDVTLSSRIPFSLSGAQGSGAKIIVEGTEIIVKNSVAPQVGSNQNYAIFHILYNENSSHKLYTEIRIDENSTITSLNEFRELFAVKQTVDLNGKEDLKLYIEEGAMLNNIQSDTSKAFSYVIDDSKVLANDTLAATVAVVKANSDTVLTKNAAENGYTLKTFSNGDVLYLTDDVDFPGFTEEDGDTFAVWRSEEHYTMGFAPMAVYQANELSASLTNSLINYAYVRLYGDLVYVDDNNNGGIVGTDKNLVIDLDGNKLSSDGKMYIGSGNMALTVKNGIFSPYQLHARENNRLHVLDVQWSSTYLAYFARAQEVIIENSVVNLTSYMAVELNYLPSATPAEFKLINSHIIVHGKLLSGTGPSDHHEGNAHEGNAIIGIFHNYGTNIKWNVVFDKNSSVTYKGAGEAPNWLAVYSSIGNYPMDQLPNVVVEEGFKVSANCMPDFAYYVADKSDDGLYHFRRYERNDEVFSLRDAEGNAIANYHGVLTYEPDLDTYLYALTKTETKPELGDNFNANLTLFTDFKLNFFANDEVVDALYLNGIALESVDFEGKDKYVIDIPVYKAAEQLAITVSVKVGEEQHLYRTTYSVLKYANQIVSGNYAADAKELISAAMAYVQQAYIVTGAAAPEFEGVTVKARENDKTTVESLTSAISGAQLNLDSGFRFRFNLNSAYTGTLVIGNSSFEVFEGKVGELTYVEVNLRAYQLADEFSVTAGGESVTYSLAAYAKSVNDDLVNALYTYCVIAGEYKANNQ